MHARGSSLLAVLVSTAALSSTAAAYPLDHLSRTVPERGRVRCPKVPMVRYRGDVVRFSKPVTVFEGFAPRLRRFEEVVRDTAIEVYGRAPRRIRHLGTFNCRRIRGYPTWISEHGLGNGIDIAAFQFPALPKAARAASQLPRALRRHFTVSVLKHWDGRGAAGRVHARFLKTLVRRLVARGDGVFHTLLGPGYPGHANHFHFDCGPLRMVEM